VGELTDSTADAVVPNGNRSLPYGLMRMVEVQMRRLGISGFLDSLKAKGVPLSTVVSVMCVHQLNGGSSMNECGHWASDPIAVERLCNGKRVSNKTIGRALETMSAYFDDILDAIWEGMNRCYEITETDAIVDGSHIPVNGVKSKLSAYGHGANGIQNQVQFMVAQLRNPPLPFRIESYAGNESDSDQFAHFLPMIIRYLKNGSMITMDNGGAVREILNEIKESGMEYVTRVKMNESDDEWIADRGEDFICADGDACCISRTFASSERTVYIFFSAEKYFRGMNSAEKRAKKMASVTADNLYTGRKKPRKSDFLVLKKNPYVDVDVKISVQRILDPFDEGDNIKAVNELAGDRCGYFKLESSFPMDPATVLGVYRSRIAVEHLISSIKSVVKLKPLRVWKGSSINGALLMALIAQLLTSLTIVDLNGTEIERNVRGKLIKMTTKPSPRTVVQSLGQLTVTYLDGAAKGSKAIFSNFDPLNSEIMGILNATEGA
jgi:transposase